MEIERAISSGAVATHFREDASLGHATLPSGLLSARHYSNVLGLGKLRRGGGCVERRR